MGQEMDSVLPVLLILIFTLDQNTFLPKSQHEENDEENRDHEENNDDHEENNDDHEENDDEHGNQEETYQDEDCCPHLQPISSQTPTYEENGKIMKEENSTVLNVSKDIDMDEELTENIDMDEELAENTKNNYEAIFTSGNFQLEKNFTSIAFSFNSNLVIEEPRAITRVALIFLIYLATCAKHLGLLIIISAGIAQLSRNNNILLTPTCQSQMPDILSINKMTSPLPVIVSANLEYEANSGMNIFSLCKTASCLLPPKG